MLRTDVVADGPYWMRTGQITATTSSQAVLEPDVRRHRAIFYNTDDDMTAFLVVNGTAVQNKGVVILPGESREVVDNHAVTIIAEGSAVVGYQEIYK